MLRFVPPARRNDLPRRATRKCPTVCGHPFGGCPSPRRRVRRPRVFAGRGRAVLGSLVRDPVSGFWSEVPRPGAALAAKNNTKTSVAYRKEFNRCMGRVNKLGRVAHEKYESFKKQLQAIKPMPSKRDVTVIDAAIKSLELSYSKGNQNKHWYKLIITIPHMHPKLSNNIVLTKTTNSFLF